MNTSVEYAEKVISGEIVAPSQVKKDFKNFPCGYNILQHQEDHKFIW
ncbi:hypothetical protein [Bacillus sp. AFS023182]|nr:hypothetical protein [Bacillus sp. AFS023182]